MHSYVFITADKIYNLATKTNSVICEHRIVIDKMTTEKYRKKIDKTRKYFKFFLKYKESSDEDAIREIKKDIFHNVYYPCLHYHDELLVARKLMVAAKNIQKDELMMISVEDYSNMLMICTIPAKFKSIVGENYV